MDTTQTTHLSLCSGYGGIDLGLRRAIPNLRTVAYAEIEAFAIENLLARMEGGALDPAPVWPDLKTFPWGAFSDRVDILSGGYPCQPFSAAGKRLGTEDPRHLWPFIADGIKLLRPKFCFFENVEGHITLGLREVIGDLERLGYRSTWGIFSASEVGAPHQRKRVFILAVSNSLRGAAGLSRSLAWNEGIAGEFDHGGGEGGGMAITLKQGLQGRSSESLHSRRLQCEAGRSGDIAWPSRPGEPQHEWEPPRVVSGRQTLDDTQERCLRDDSDNQRQTVGEGDTANDSGSCSGEAMADSHRINRSAPPEGWQHDRQVGSAGEGLGDTESQRSATQWAKHEGLSGELCSASASGERGEGNGQAEPSLGGDADGTTSGLDYAELCVSGDNRTDELRLLGNGVVPATATLAFRTLLQEIISA